MGVSNKLRKFVADPDKYISLGLKMLQQRTARIFQDSAFFMQGQMDINSKSRWFNEQFTNETGGFFVAGDAIERRIADLQPWDLVRRDMLVLLLRDINSRRVEGDLAEVGVYRGHTAKLFHHYMPDRKLHLFDTFCGFPEIDVEVEKGETGVRATAGHFNDTSVEGVYRYISKINGNVLFYPGRFPDSVTSKLNCSKFAFVHLDADLYAPTMAGLSYFYDKVTTGGFVVVHDYNAWPGARKAVDEFFRRKAETPIPMPDKSGSALILKT